jgi:toxin HigB-1
MRTVSLYTAQSATIGMAMKIRNVIHRGLRRFIEEDDASGLQPAVVAKLRRMVSFLQEMEREDELRTVPIWKAHLLTGDRKGTWSLSVTKNWRMTFRIDSGEVEILDLDYEDYH